eukprot:CAMPEP_0168337146 /NCGR_PEP_ID=MMETSP0213-20121227/11988_1 /TAXON_ID=151035 /ORGANISM="Euplotes harpa, Strain FSP1.4" /LENGTH=257 /DNA_ID=CAMNT_0008342523 /DNA_START=1170 /DNA_END=1942 /DNA_ORIENTATION=-
MRCALFSSGGDVVDGVDGLLVERVVPCQVLVHLSSEGQEGLHRLDGRLVLDLLKRLLWLDQLVEGIVLDHLLDLPLGEGAADVGGVGLEHILVDLKELRVVLADELEDELVLLVGGRRLDLVVESEDSFESDDSVVPLLSVVALGRLAPVVRPGHLSVVDVPGEDHSVLRVVVFVGVGGDNHGLELAADLPLFQFLEEIHFDVLEGELGRVLLVLLLFFVDERGVGQVQGFSPIDLDSEGLPHSVNDGLHSVIPTQV